MRRHIQLAKPGNSAHRAVMFIDYDGVGIRGEGDIDYECAHCGRVLAESVEERTIWDLAIECPSCKLASDFPRLPPGATASGTYVFVPEGRYRITEAIPMGKGGLLIGIGEIKGP